MKFDSVETNALLQSHNVAPIENVQNSPASLFLLPTIHSDIPRKAILSEKFSREEQPHWNDCNLNQLALNLVHCGVIDPSAIPDHVETVHEIISIGLSNWFKDRAGEIGTIPFKFSVMDHPTLIEVAAQTSADCDMYDYFKEEKFVLATIGEETQIREMKDKIESISKISPRLAFTVIRAIYKASAITADIWLPHEIFSEFARYYWEDYSATLPRDEEVVGYVTSNFDAKDPEDSESLKQIQSMLPSSVVPAMGGKLCLDLISRRQLLSRKQLKRLAGSTDDKLVQDVACATSSLLKAISQAKRIGAKLTTDDIPYAMRVSRGLLLVHQFNDRVAQIVDAEVNDAWQSGTATDVIGFIKIPDHPYEIQIFFDKIEKALLVLKKLDTLIEKISERYYRD